MTRLLIESDTCPRVDHRFLTVSPPEWIETPPNKIVTGKHCSSRGTESYNRMEVLRLPPRIKVLEALSALVGGRLEILSDNMCKVRSSDGSRTYTVYVDLERGVAYSDDNGTRFRGYVGYPIIAFLMYKKILPVDENIGKGLASIPWRQLNEKYRKYDIVMSLVLDKLERDYSIPRHRVLRYVNEVMSKLSKIKLRRLDRLPL